MYKLIFADDETLVRSKISRMIDWESIGFSLVACCENGYELMEMVERELPDLVILDINMPFISGLEAARQIHHSYPHIRLIFLTGYSEFEYAKQAIDLNALHYIVKPVAAQELTDLLSSAKQELDAEQERIWHLMELERIFAETEKILMQELLEGKVDEESLCRHSKLCGKEWNKQTQFQVALLLIDKTGSAAKWKNADEELLRYALCNVATEIMCETKLGFADMRGDNVLLLGFAQPSEELTQRMQQCVELILHTVSTQLNFTITAGMSDVCKGYQEVASAAVDAKRAAELRAKEGGNRLFTMQDLQQCAGMHTVVWDAVNYIEQMYANPQLCADGVCESLHVSPSYLRALFKKQTGCTIIGYITKARMERAGTLLADKTLKSGTVAEMVGYTDPHYFSYCFRRYYNMTPMEMRKRLNELS